jgi:hypothetical protein
MEVGASTKAGRQRDRPDRGPKHTVVREDTHMRSFGRKHFAEFAISNIYTRGARC